MTECAEWWWMELNPAGGQSRVVSPRAQLWVRSCLTSLSMIQMRGLSAQVCRWHQAGRGQALEQAAQGSGGVTISGGVQKTRRYGTSGYGLAGTVVLGWWLDLMILEVFCNLNDSMILKPPCMWHSNSDSSSPNVQTVWLYLCPQTLFDVFKT